MGEFERRLKEKRNSILEIGRDGEYCNIRMNVIMGIIDEAKKELLDPCQVCYNRSKCTYNPQGTYVKIPFCPKDWKLKWFGD